MMDPQAPPLAGLNQAMLTQSMRVLTSQPTLPTLQSLPSLSYLSNTFSSFFPIRPKDVNFVYHSPRYRLLSQLQESSPQSGIRTLPTDSTLVSRVILSITPTPGVYQALNKSCGPRPLLFLHRPFTLDRRRVPRGVTVLSSHTGFDEVLTVGYNSVLAARLGVDVDSSVCLQGYKGDSERRIGLVGALTCPLPASQVSQWIKREFRAWDSVHGFLAEDDAQVDAESAAEIKVVAIMNAFHPDEVRRVLEAAHSRGWISNADDGASVLYLTGQAREPGLAAALEKGIKVVCVGHRVCEEWGIRYLAEEMRIKFPLLEVVEVMEEEELPPPRVKKEKPMSAGRPLTKKQKTAGPTVE